MNLADLDLNLLKSFEALMQTRSVTAAARRLGVSQPAMSAALNRLRLLVGDELLVRSGRGMLPTPRAVALTDGVTAALDQVRAALAPAIVFEPERARRTFTVAVSDYASFVVLPRLSACLEREAPGIDVRAIGYDKDDAGELLDDGLIDMAIGVFNNPPKRCRTRPLLEERFVGVVRRAHPIVQDGQPDLATFSHLNHILVTQRRDAVGKIDELLAGHGLSRRIALTLPHMLAVPATVAATDHVCALARRVAHHFASSASLHLFELPVRQDPWTVSLMWSATSRGDPAGEWIRDALLRCLSDLDS